MTPPVPLRKKKSHNAGVCVYRKEDRLNVGMFVCKFLQWRKFCHAKGEWEPGTIRDSSPCRNYKIMIVLIGGQYSHNQQQWGREQPAS